VVALYLKNGNIYINITPLKVSWITLSAKTNLLAINDKIVAFNGLEGDVVCMTSFGESAPADQLFKEFGFTVDNVVKTVNEVLA
jgi:transketolase